MVVDGDEEIIENELSTVNDQDSILRHSLSNHCFIINDDDVPSLKPSFDDSIN